MPQDQRAPRPTIVEELVAALAPHPKKPTIFAAAIVSHPKSPASVAVFDLEYDPDIYLDANQDALQRI
jgi:hypothetical protein